MPVAFVPSTNGDPRTARFFAQAVDLAYFNAEGPAKFKDELGLDARLVSVGNTQVYVATNADAIFCCFRGSEMPYVIDGFKDWFVTNANNLLVLPDGKAGSDFAAAGVGARFHRGFLEALDAMWAPFVAAVEEEYTKAERPIWVCGHSLGGALALLAAWRMERNALPVQQVYTFGAPMVGNAAASAALEKTFRGRVYRFVDVNDIVPKLPTISLTSNMYEHCPQEMALGAGAGVKLSTELAPGAEIPPAAVGGVWSAVMGQLESHFMNNYISKIEKLCKG